MADQYYLPPQTSELLKKHLASCKNLGLILDKYVPQHIMDKDDAQNVIDKSEKKGPWLRSLVQKQSHVDGELFQAVALRQRRMLANIRGIHPFSAALAWRMVIGLGGESVLETDLTLHHLYGVPIIPGSALKGLTRAYAATEEEKYFIIDKKDKDKPKPKPIPSPEAEKDAEDLQRIFGSQKRAGTVIFFDALPVDTNISFVVDIMNPHYPNYYKSLKENTVPPDNDQAPIPIPFLTIADTTFLFALAPRDASDEQHVADVEQAQKWLKLALQKYGVGGKTSAGYGYFTINEGNEANQQALTEGQSSVSTSMVTKQAEMWKRPNIPVFTLGAVLPDCFVIEPTEEMRQLSPNAKTFLRFRENPPKIVYVVIEEETPDIQNWTLRQQKACIYQKEERRENSLVLICSPKPKSEKKKK